MYGCLFNTRGLTMQEAMQVSKALPESVGSMPVGLNYLNRALQMQPEAWWLLAKRASLLVTCDSATVRDETLLFWTP